MNTIRRFCSVQKQSGAPYHKQYRLKKAEAAMEKERLLLQQDIEINQLKVQLAKSVEENRFHTSLAHLFDEHKMLLRDQRSWMMSHESALPRKSTIVGELMHFVVRKFVLYIVISLGICVPHNSLL